MGIAALHPSYIALRRITVNHWNPLRFSSLIGSMIFFCAVATGWGAESSLERFVSSPSRESWQVFKSDVHLGYYKSNGSVFLKLIEYHEAREKRDLPNSMALKNITPDQFVRMQIKRADEALVYLRKNNDAEFWRVVEKLAVQEFDEGLARTALEIIARLSPKRFDAMTAALRKQNADKSRIIEDTRSKWLPR
jgi:hypothetical protein